MRGTTCTKSALQPDDKARAAYMSMTSLHAASMRLGATEDVSRGWGGRNPMERARRSHMCRSPGVSGRGRLIRLSKRSGWP